MSKRKIALLGSTGSIGRQVLEVIDRHSDLWEVEVLTANNNVDLLIRQALRYRPRAVVIANEQAYGKIKEALDAQDIKVYATHASVTDMARCETADVVLNALVGFSGLEPSLSALEAGKVLALANKESLVAGGALLTRRARTCGGTLLPVDSEHSAVFQCLEGEHAKIEKIILTASGGPFLHTPSDRMQYISKEDALRHPVWNMGAKVTIDSATMMNKALEIIEAYWLFDLDPSQIEVLIHPQSVIHSMVQFADGCVKAQLSCPDMRLPIQYALSYPFRLDFPLQRIDFARLGALTFLAPDPVRFPALRLAYVALERGGNIPCALNAANEWANRAFLQDRMGFVQIAQVVEKVMDAIEYIAQPNLEQLKQTHFEAGLLAQNLLKINN